MKTTASVRTAARLVPALVLALVLNAAAATAGPVLRCQPADTAITQTQTVALSFRIDEPLELRTVELWVHFDPAVITSVSARPGLLFRTCGAYVWADFEETSPGHWHGFAVVMGSTVWVTGPGELYEWTFQGSALGITTVAADSVRLFDPLANVIPGASLLPARVKVWDPALSGVPPERACGLSVFPNPFNPTARVRFTLPVAGATTLEVLDLLGRRLGVLVQEPAAAAGTREVVWDGTDAAGHAAPSGVYLFRLRGPEGVSGLARGVLVR